MAVIKVKRPNGEEHTFNLTSNRKDTGGNYICVHFNGEDYYARISNNPTPLNVLKPNGDRGYVQVEPMEFTTWKWESSNVDKFNRWYVFLPKGKYRILTEGIDKEYHDLTMQTSNNIEITITTQKIGPRKFIIFNINNQISSRNYLSYNMNRLIIERIGDV